MRRVTAIMALTCVVALSAGCTGGSATHRPAPGASAGSPGPAPSGTPTPRRSLDAASAAACADARRVIRADTGRLTTQLQVANAALDRGDRAGAAKTVPAIHEIFAQWSKALRQRAAKVADPDLQIVIIEYAGAVDATIARIKTVDDLDKLYTFTEKELDVTASRFAEVCPE